MKYLRRWRRRSRAGSRSSRWLDEDGRRPLPVRRDDAGHAVERSPVVRHRLERAADRRLALALEHAVDRPVGVLEDLAGDERGAVAADEDERARAGARASPSPGRRSRARWRGSCTRTRPRRAATRRAGGSSRRAVSTCRSISANLVPGPPRRRRDQLEPQRLQPEEDLRVHETARMDGEKAHGLVAHAHMSGRNVCRLAPGGATWACKR